MTGHRKNILFCGWKMAETQVHNWLRLVAAGDEQAFRALYDQYSGKAYSVALSYLRDPLGAQDVAQEIFVKVWENREDLPTVRNFGAWVGTLARNYVINALQKKVPANFEVNISDREFVDEGMSPETGLDAKQMEKMIQEAIAALPPRQGEVYRLSEDEELTINEISNKLGISYHTTRGALAAALKNIRRYLVEHYGELGLLLWILVRS
jgi:RNA polymerase sigma-70 factor (family 1)